MEPKLARLLTVKCVELNVTSPMSLEYHVPFRRAQGNVQESEKYMNKGEI